MSNLSQEIKRQTRNLWRECFHDSEDFMDIYFDEKYTDETNLTLRHEGQTLAATQLFPYRLTLYGSVTRMGYVSGLATDPAFRGKGHAARLLRHCHRKLFHQNAALSLLIPGDDGLRKFYENPRHGSYWTSSYRKTEPLDTSADGDFGAITVTCLDDWDDSLFVFFRRLTSELPFMVHPSRSDFFAAIEAAHLGEAYLLAAHHGRRMVGLCLAVREDDGRILIRSIAIAEAEARAAFVDWLCRHCEVEKVWRRYAARGTEPGAEPYAMARVTDAHRFLSCIAAPNPNFSMRIGVGGDYDMPENNGWYELKDGRVTLTDQQPERIVTPGGLAAMFLAAQPLILDLMMDE
ncbi:MAG: GNAT family N-acetyltransferase [Alloprevotella sp.]